MAMARGGYIQQLASGSFRVSVYAGTDPLTGRQIRLRKTCKTERAAQIELGKLLEQAGPRSGPGCSRRANSTPNVRCWSARPVP